MLVWLTLPLKNNFCSFRSVAVNSVYKLQLFTFMTGISNCYRTAAVEREAYSETSM